MFVGPVVLASLLLLAACGEEEKETAPKKAAEPKTEKAAETESTEAAEAGTEAVEETTNEPEEAAGSDSNEVLNPAVAEQSEGEVEVVYTNKNPGYSHDMDGFKVFIDEYQVVKVTDMLPSVTIPFDDQTEGYVVTAKVTLENGTGKPAYYNNSQKIQLDSEYTYIPGDKVNFINENDRVKSATETETGKYAAGEKVTGLVNFLFTNEEFEALKTVKPKYIIEGGMADNDQFKNSFNGEGNFDFTFNDDQAKESAGADKFYPDQLTTDNVADKKLIFEKTGINETKQIGDVKVTLEGVQYTEITPGAANKARFKNFGDSGIVALTVKLNLDNQSNQPINLSIVSKLRIDENRGTAYAEGMLEPVNPREIQAGAQGEKYHVFLFNKDEFEIFKKFTLEFGPFIGDKGKSIFKEKTAEFNLPR